MTTPNVEQVIKLKFRNDADRQLYAVDEGLMDLDEAMNAAPEELTEVSEGIIKRRLIGRRKKKHRVKDLKRSRLMKKLWKSKRRNFEKGIRKFHKSIKGKRLHQKMARNRKNGKYRNISEWYTGLSSLMTHLSIEASYTSSINEEADMELIWEAGQDILGPVLSEMPNLDMRLDEEFNSDFNEYLQTIPEAMQFIDDLLGMSDLHEDYQPLESCTVDDELSMDDLGTTNITETDDDKSGEVSGGDYDDKSTANDKLAKDKDEDTGSNRKKDEDTEDDSTDESYNPSSSELVDISESYTSCPELDTQDDFQMITESAGDPDVDGEHVIAKIIGPAFFPGRTSRNNVEYLLDLWQTCINRPEFKRELEARRIYGTFGHDLVIDDEAIREGKIGHIVKDVWIDADTGVGMAEYLILNTGPGQMIKTLFGAKSKVRVSTRARGKMLAQRFNGRKRPDPNKFYLRAIDFVHDPGFLEAEPSLA